MSFITSVLQLSIGFDIDYRLIFVGVIWLLSVGFVYEMSETTRESKACFTLPWKIITYPSRW